MSKVKTWEEIEDDFRRMDSMSCKPNFTKLPRGWITDENQTVKWNREQVELNNQNYQKAVAELNTKKNKMRDIVLNDIYERIQYQVGHNLSLKSAIKIWNYAYEIGHGFGFNEIKCHLGEIMDLVADILDIQNMKDEGNQ